MPKRLTYKFTIGAFSPETIPMSRLSKYMSDLAGLLGEPSSVHFAELEEGSTVLAVTVDIEAIPKVIDRVEQIRSGYIPDEVKKHFETLDRRLAADNATGELVALTEEDVAGAVVITFPGCERQKPIDYGVIKERGTLDGVPFSIGGRDRIMHIQLQDGSRTHSNIDLTQELGIELSDAHVLRRKMIRLHGEGRWRRNPGNGEWDLIRFRVEGFEILDDASLGDTLAELRGVKGSGWADLYQVPLSETHVGDSRIGFFLFQDGKRMRVCHGCSCSSSG